MNGKGKGKCWYINGGQDWLIKLEMPAKEEDILEIKKSSWKRELKKKIEQIVETELEEESRKMTKLRFFRQFKRQEYVKECKIETVRKIMQMRSNMVEIKANFKG